MYLKFYGLETHPFSIAPDPRFFYGSDVHKEGLAHLQYGLIQKKGFVLITGEAGTGKTTLLNLLLKKVPKYTRTAFISNPKLSVKEFFYLISKAFSLGDISDKADFLIKIGKFLQEAKRDEENVILIVDEAHCLSEELLEEIRLLSNLETPEGKLMNIILVGQPEIKEILQQDNMKALNQRITLRYHIRPLSRDETKEYVHVRLMKAGAKDVDIFSIKALDAIFRFTGGIPRLINVLADKALLTGFVKEQERIDDNIIEECAAEMELVIPQQELKSDLSHGRTTFGYKPSWLKFLAVVLVAFLIVFFILVLSGHNVPESLSFFNILFD